MQRLADPNQGVGEQLPARQEFRIWLTGLFERERHHGGQVLSGMEVHVTAGPDFDEALDHFQLRRVRMLCKHQLRRLARPQQP